MFRLFRAKGFLVFLALINFAAAFFSLSFYWNQLVENPFLWFVVADCPFYAFLFGLNLLLLVGGKTNGSLSFISIMGNFKYGFWTVFVLFVSGQAGLFWWVVLAHLLMVLETIVLLGLFKFTIKNVLVALVWFALNDFFDFVFGLHPFVSGGYLFCAAVFALSCTIVLPLILSVLFSFAGQKILTEKKVEVRGRFAR
jgi:uncharacterized membrane protein YpjA